MAFIFTVLPRIYDKFIASNNENDIRLLPLEALNNQALSIAANITSHGGYYIIYYYTKAVINLLIKLQVIGLVGSSCFTGYCWVLGV